MVWSGSTNKFQDHSRSSPESLEQGSLSHEVEAQNQILIDFIKTMPDRAYEELEQCQKKYSR